MAAKLTSISRQIHWSSLIKAVVFAAAWWYLPTWLFLALACIIYFVPPFEARNNLPAFLVLLGISLATARAAVMAAVLAVLCYYLLLIKDFLVVDRKLARTVLAMALSFFLFREFFLSWYAGLSAGALAWAWVMAIAFGMLLNGVIVARRGKEVSDEHDRDPRRVAVLASMLVMFEILVACLFLPVDFIYQSIIAFLVAALILDLVPAYFFHELEP
ncbi:MAG TPA: hypothetical protein VLX68_10245, partial [Chitinivibrionales bacterium]|nr:hypothetical protein [Chitinivibrionales bacterium]